MDDRTDSEKIEDLTDRIKRLEAFIIRNSVNWDEDMVAAMLNESSMRNEVNQTVNADCYVTASLQSDT